MTKACGRTSIRRRTFLAGTGASLLAGSATASSVRPAAKSKNAGLALWYDRPAERWVEALPVGNGRVAAMVFGRVAQERLTLNEGTLWAGSPYDPVNPDALAALPEVRRLIAEERFKDAMDLASKTMMAKPLSQMPYGTAGDVLLDFVGHSFAGGYRRSLDLSEAVAQTAFRANGGTITREVFASEPDQVIVVRLTATGGAKLAFDVGYRHPKKAEYDWRPKDGIVTREKTDPVDWNFREDLDRAGRPSDLHVAPDGAKSLLITGRNIESAGIPAGLQYAVRIAAQGDGRIEAIGDVLSVRGARAVTLVIAAATSFVSPARVDADPVAPVRQRTNAALTKRYAALRRDHIAAHRRLFDRFSITLGKPSTEAVPTDQRIVRDGESLAALYVQYARYLMISSSRGTGQPANLQGIWNDGLNPPWGSKYTINANTQMNYWPVDPANLAECYEPLIRMVEELAVSGAHTAKVMYGARGWVAHHNTDLWRASAPIDGPYWGMWPMGAAWLCTALWDHYDYTRDPALLKRLYPLMKGASLFFVDALVEDPKGRGLVTSPSISPENAHHPDVTICAGPAMDRQILRDLFAATLEAHALSKDPDTGFATVLADKGARLPKDRIGAQGQLQEWLDDWDVLAPEQQHRHVSHLYGVFPSTQINVRDTPDLIAAAKVTLNKRGDLSTGWATAWRICLWARMGEGERAYSVLKGLLSPLRSYPNLFDAHPPFQIDGNFGGSTGIIEMIVQSWGGEVRILPALPKVWADGRIEGLRVRGGAELSLAWQNGELSSLTVKGPPSSEIKIRYRDTLETLRLDSAGKAVWS
ncbi:glycoside hydrolase family 95 protein [Rhizomicrobium electricum]|uniref:Glycoside hydrolase family 95 protein n=1 Tax=Rhizomicrobium electricum TaxID=480070 RepID=A0ABP3P7S4_9PROT|nr:glycoside hydrolase family 95 protein [Rhizomicrobium electricum]NIJ48012.1 alpha-L-fucosidase 2 [Rhizomicrobium electricum]